MTSLTTNDAKLANGAATILRIALGVMFLSHSLILKLYVFTLAGNAQFFQSLGLPGWLGYATFFAEVIGGVLRASGIGQALASSLESTGLPVIVAAFVVVSIVLVDVRQAMAFASFCVLVHFALLHASAWTLDPRWSRRVVPALGLVGCLGVAALLPWQSVVAGVLVLLLGAVIGWVRHATRE